MQLTQLPFPEIIAVGDYVGIKAESQSYFAGRVGRVTDILAPRTGPTGKRTGPSVLVVRLDDPELSTIIEVSSCDRLACSDY